MILSEDNILRELAFTADNNPDISNFLKQGDDLLDNLVMEAEEYDKVTQRLQLDILDVERFVKVNNCPCVSDPRAFVSNNIPSAEGLLSNKLFGTAYKERAGTFGYIDLHGWFIDPSCYKTWIRLDSKIKNIVFGVKYYRIDEHGDLIEDDNGDTGLDWLRQNMNRIRFKRSDSKSKQLSIKYLETNRDRMWIRKYIVIPPFYRDKNTSSNSRATVGLGGVNKLYTNLIVSTNALLTPQEYGFDADDAEKGRIQNIILQIYDFFCGNANKDIPADSVGAGLSKKLGLLRMTNMSKTADFSSRLVISPVDLKVNKPDELMVNYDRSAVPLYSAITQFRDFVMFNVREFFENEFTGSTTYPVIDKNGKEKYVYPEDPEIEFSDERIAKEMDRFLEGYNNRFVPIEVPVEGTKEKYYMIYKGMYTDPSNPEKSQLVSRRLTWCDVFYIATVEATRDKHVLITRFPM